MEFRDVSAQCGEKKCLSIGVFYKNQDPDHGKKKKKKMMLIPPMIFLESLARH